MNDFDRIAPAHCAELLHKFGQTPYGDNVFRVVWSESVTELVGGLYEDRLNFGRDSTLTIKGNMVLDTNPVVQKVPCYRESLRYAFKEPRWILEKWLPQKYSRDDWEFLFTNRETGLGLLGPYMEFGDWHLSYKLEDRGQYAEPTVESIETYARCIEAGLEYAEHHRLAAYQAKLDEAERDYNRRFDDIYEDSQLAGGTTNLFMPVSGPIASKARVKPEDVNFESAEKYGLPTRSGMTQV